MQVFGELYEFNEQLIMNLKYNRSSIQAVAAKFRFIPKIIGGEKVLTGEDNKFIDDYFFNIGKSDALSQIDYLSARSASLTKMKEDSLSDYKRYSSLYIKIFFLIGVLLAVLLA